MGEHNSSITRVWPVFDHLFDKDPTGASWFGDLLRMGSRAGKTDIASLVTGDLRPDLAKWGRPLPSAIRSALRTSGAPMVPEIRWAYEADSPPPAAFLRWLIENASSLSWPRDPKTKALRRYGPTTQSKREELRNGNQFTRTDALNALAAAGGPGSRRKWWAFEGFTSVDCTLETETVLVYIEGKRFEPVSRSTEWFPKRNQVVRNLEVAKERAAGREYYVLVCSESPPDVKDSDFTDGLPHFSDAEIAELKRHYLGHVLWGRIVSDLCPGLVLPENVEEALAGFRPVR